MMTRLLVPVISMAALGLLFGAGLAYALKVLGIKIDETLTLILARLPGANCGACGKAGCAGFAEALKKGEALPSSCVVANEEARRSIAELLGVEYSAKTKTVAAVLCNGGVNAADKYVYKGIKSCKADVLIFGGHKACGYGCLGHGDCVRACPFEAIKMTKQGIPEVDASKCTACGKCLEACPKNLYILLPVEQSHYVKCNSKDPGPAVRKVCKAGCIACGVCEKLSEGAFKVTDNLARLDYESAKAKDMDLEKIAQKCPTKVIAAR